MFYHLAKALVVLEHGPKSQSLLRQPIEDEVLHSDETLGDETILEPNQNPTTSAASQSQPVEPWKPIVHNDLKPQNSMFLSNFTEPVLILSTVFLGDEDFDTFSFYPTAKLGDFGNAFLYTPGESQEAVKPGGTASYQAHDDTKGPWSNIHGVGICMFEAVTLEDHIASSVIAKNKQKAKPKDHIASSVKAKNKQKEKAKEGCVKAAGSKSLGSPKAEDSDLFDWRCQGRTPCSRRLELLILRCLERNVKDRITARELLSETRKALSEIRHELEEGYGLDAGPVVNSDGKKESKRLPDDYPFKLSYHGSEIEGTSYGNYVCKFNKRPYLQNDYFPELYTEGLYPMRFPMRDDFKCTMASEDLDHLRMPWETADEWNARERDWPGVEGKYDPSDPFADIDLFELEQPPSDADGAGHEWTTDEETKTVLKNQRNEENRAWATEAKQRKKDNAQVKKKAEMKLREALFARLAERKKRNRGERVSRSPKRRKLVSTSVEAAKSEGKQPEKETEGDEEEEDDGDDEDSEYDDSEDDKSEDDSSGDEDDEDEDGDEDEDDEDEDGDEDEDDD